MTSPEIESFCSVTGANANVAQAYLSSCSNNLDTAVSLFMDNPTLFSETTTDASDSISEDIIRAPIPQFNDQLLPSSSHQTFAMNPELRNRLAIRRAFVSPDDPESYSNQNISFGAIGSSSTNGSSTDAQSRAKFNHLSKIFQPPKELMFEGSLQQAREVASAQKKWILVSLHDDTCFDCHIMNRDVWKDFRISSLVKKNFIFMQPLVESMDGFWYRSHFPYVSSASHLSVLDPTTGKEICMWTHLNEADAIHTICEFLYYLSLIDSVIFRRPQYLSHRCSRGPWSLNLQAQAKSHLI
ncbi:UBX domain-containing protein 7 [Cichlidogyrus casuarinus]|uniref:UBX domain-containing protein 7 n=1 Tax=Cichlidogyrus casuarinus TaxID=1844966 RepID=A0ABD2Q8E8_9PLAT